MSPQSPKELLAQLRLSLKHFDDNPAMGAPRDVTEIRSKLLQRIADVERIVRLTMKQARQQNL